MNFIKVCFIIVLPYIIASYASDMISDYLGYESYEKQVDTRKKEFYPSTVIDMQQKEFCYETHCETSHTVVVELEDGNYVEINATKNAFDQARIGGVLSFERHLTDPKVISYNFVKVISILIAFTVMCVLLIMFRARS